MANYPVERTILQPLLPARTELDMWGGETYVSLVGFQFRNVRIRGMRIPYHTDFPEVNLRFYVRFKDEGGWKRGVVFIREIVPLRAVTFVANTLFQERYITLRMKSVEQMSGDQLEVGYGFHSRKGQNVLTAFADPIPCPLVPGSQEEFITEHFWGYTGNSRKAGEYQVAHPRWDIYTINQHLVTCDFKNLYGAAFGDLHGRNPQSIFLAEGSPVEVYTKRPI